MNGFQAIKRQLLPLLKGMPFIAAALCIALFIAKKVIQYTPNTYQTIARIKLDDLKYGFSKTELYADFDVFSTENKIQAEAAVLKSPLLLSMALDSLDFSVSISRKGRLKNTLLYRDSPIVVEFDLLDNVARDKDYFLHISGSDTYQIVDEDGEDIGYPELSLGQSTELSGGFLTVRANHALLSYRDLTLEGDYLVHPFSHDGLIADVTERLDVVEVDKEIPIIRVVYKDQHPQKVADLANALCKAYINDYIATKSQAASQTVEFIDKKINEVQQKLQRAEIELEQYKAVNGVVNTRQETETGLRQISSLEVQLINLEMNEKAIIELEEYIASGDYFADRAINFGFGDLLMTELVKKLKLWQDERIDLMVKYTAESDQVLAVDQKIEEVKNYIVEAIKRNKVEILTKRAEIEASVELASKQFEGLSTREKEMRILERNFHLQEQVYNFLSQKKIEASIASTATLSFHRIIQTARVPKEPASPNATLILFVSGMLALIVSIAVIYLRQFGAARVTDRQDIERHSSIPILGVVRRADTNEDFRALIKNMQLKGFLSSNALIAISSTIGDEGRSYVADHLAQQLGRAGLRVALLQLDEDASSPTIAHFLEQGEEANFGVTSLSQHQPLGLNWKEQLQALKSRFDAVIMDAPAAAVSMDGVEAMKLADLALYLVRANRTSIDYLTHADRLAEEYEMDHIRLVLNDAHRASNHDGVFVGTRFRATLQNLGFAPRMKAYLNTYMR